MDAFWYIRQFPLFDQIPADALHTLMERVHDDLYETKTLLYTPSYIPNERTQGVFMVKHGEVNLYHVTNGKRFVFETIRAGGLFGDFDPDQRTPEHSAEAAAGTRTYFFKTADFLHILSEHPSVLMKTIHLLAERIRFYEQRFNERAFDARKKILSELRRHYSQSSPSFLQTDPSSNGQKLTHEQIAERTGLNRVTVTRAIQELIGEGILSKDGKGSSIIFHPQQTTKRQSA